MDAIQSPLALGVLPKSVLEALELSSQFYAQNRFYMLRTAVRRYGVVGWGGAGTQKGKQATSDADAFLEGLPVERLGNVITAVERGCKLLGLDARGTSKNCSYARAFLNLAEKQGWLEANELVNKHEKKPPAKVYRLQRPNGQRRIYEVSSTGAGLTPSNALGTSPKDYVCVNDKKVLGNEHFQTELEEFSASIEHLASAENILHKIRQAMGYLHRIKKVSLTELHFAKLIPFIKLTYVEEDFDGDPAFQLNPNGTPKYPSKMEQKLSLSEGIAKRRIKQKAKEIVIWADEYLKWHDQCRKAVGATDGLANATKQLHLDALIVLAKYTYRFETESKTFDDISIITSLKAKRDDFVPNRQKQKARVKARCISWKDASAVIELQRETADIRYGVPQRHPDGFYPHKRLQRAIAIDLQKALVLLLMVLIPSDRQQTYRRLQYREEIKLDEQVEGEFLLLGEIVDGVFTPKAKMKNASQAQWWIAIYHFKTIEKYGPFWYPIPNQQFRDHKNLYEYLEMWFFGLKDEEEKWAKYHNGANAEWQGFVDEEGNQHGWREALQPDHPCTFSMPYARKPFNTQKFSALVKRIFVRFTQELGSGKITPVTPHSFRSMLATHTEQQSGQF